MPLSLVEFYCSHLTITLAACIGVHLLMLVLQHRQQALYSKTSRARTLSTPVRRQS